MIFTFSRAFKALVATLAMAEALVDYLEGNQRSYEISSIIHCPQMSPLCM